MKVRRIEMGRLIATTSVAAAMEQYPLFAAITQAMLADHLQGICPHMDEHDRGANRRAVTNGGERVFTSWPTGIREHPEVWIVTESDRSATTLLWPDEY